MHVISEKFTDVKKEKKKNYGNASNIQWWLYNLKQKGAVREQHDIIFG